MDESINLCSEILIMKWFRAKLPSRAKTSLGKNPGESNNQEDSKGSQNDPAASNELQHMQKITLSQTLQLHSKTESSPGSGTNGERSSPSDLAKTLPSRGNEKKTKKEPKKPKEKKSKRSKQLEIAEGTSVTSERNLASPTDRLNQNDTHLQSPDATTVTIHPTRAQNLSPNTSLFSFWYRKRKSKNIETPNDSIYSPGIPTSNLQSPQSIDLDTQNHRVISLTTSIKGTTSANLTTNAVDEGKVRTLSDFERPRYEPYKVALKAFLIFIFFIALGLISGLIANDYNEPDYLHWGEFFFDGILTALLAAMFFHRLIHNEQKKNSTVTYSALNVVTVILLIFSPLLSTGLNAAFETAAGGRNCFTYAGVKCLVLLLNALLYCLYLLSKKMLQKEIYEQQRTSKFFYTNVYRNFLAELSTVRVDLSQRMQNRHLAGEGTERSHMGMQSGRASPRKESIHITSPNHREIPPQEKCLNVASPKVCIKLHCILILLVLQFMATMGLYEIIGHYPAWTGQQDRIKIFTLTIAYPFVMWLFRKGMLKLERDIHTKIFDDYIEFLSLGLAAIPYRKIFFYITEFDEALIVYGVKIGYKLLFYVVYACLMRSIIHGRHTCWISLKGKMSKIKKYFKKCFKKKNENAMVSLKLATRKSIFASTTIKEFALNDEQVSKFVMRFLLIEFFDIANIIYSTLMLLMLRGGAIGQYYRTFTSTMASNYVKFAGVDLAFEVATLLIVYVGWRLNKDFNTVMWRDYIKWYLDQPKKPFLLMSSFILFSSSFFTIYYGTEVGSISGA